MRIMTFMPELYLMEGPPWIQVYTEHVVVLRSGWRSDIHWSSFMASLELAWELAVEPLAYVRPVTSDYKAIKIRIGRSLKGISLFCAQLNR